ncbi:hypothetical protein C0416_01270 [bacterium]|nr:hypothetical protein [bacterium]
MSEPTTEKKDPSSPQAWEEQMKHVEGKSVWPPATPEKGLDYQKTSSTEKVAERKEAGKTLEEAKGKLLEYWKNNNKEGVTTIEAVKDSDDFKILVLSIKDKEKAKDIYLLLSLIEKKRGKDEAKKIYEEALKSSTKDKGGVVTDMPIEPFRKPFEAEYAGNAKAGSPGKTFGFYFCTKNCQKGEALGGHTLDKDTKGWFSYDVNEDALDEYSGTDSISKAYKHIETEFKAKEQDSSLSPEQQTEILALFEALENKEGEYKKFTAEENRGVLEKWFKENAKDKWKLINDDHIRNLMNAMYGASVGAYFYRYNEKENKVYFIGINGEEVSNGKCGYIDITSKGVRERSFFTNGTEGLKDTLLKDMDPGKVFQEAGIEAGKRGDKVADSLVESATKGLLVDIHNQEKERAVKYSRLKPEYLDILEGKLKEKLVSDGHQNENAEKMAQKAISNLKEKIEKKINESEELKQAINPENDFVLNISLDKNGEPSVELRDAESKSKLAEKLADLKDTAEGALDDQVAGEKSAEMMKKLGPLAAILSFFGVDLKKDIMDSLKPGGKKSFALTAIGFFTSVEIGRRVLKGKGFSSMKDIEEIAGDNGGKLKKDQEFKKELKLEGYKIIIPKGKGIKLAENFVANGVELIKPEKKKKFNLFDFGSSDKEFVLDDQEITIVSGDTIPEGTVLPQEAKIEKVAAAV